MNALRQQQQPPEPPTVMIPTHGWEPEFRVAGLCSHCLHAIREDGLVACEHAQSGFPAAGTCELYISTAPSADWPEATT